MRPPVFLFIDKTSGNGGGPTFLRMLREVVHTYSQAAGVPGDCLSLIDERDDHRLHRRAVDQTGFIGCAGSRLRFVLEAWCMTRRRPRGLVIVGHIGLAPVAWLLKNLALIDTYVIVIYGKEAWRRRGWLERLAIGRSDAVVALSRYTERQFARHNPIHKTQSRVILPAVNWPCPVAKPFRAEGGAFHVLSVGRLSRRDHGKGFDNVLRAFAALRSQCPEVQLTMAGDGDDLPRLRRLAQELQIQDDVVFPGPVTEPELAALYGACDVFIMLSREEGFGLVFLEAMSFGKPCVGAGAGGSVEAIDHGVDGYLVDAADSQAQASCLKKLLENKALRLQMGERAERKVLGKFLFAHMESAWHILLRELQGRSRA